MLYMTACVEWTIHKTHTLLLPLYASCTGLLLCLWFGGWLNLGQARQGDSAVICVAAITHHMQPAACQCFSAQSYKMQKQFNMRSGQAPQSTAAEAVGAILQKPTFSTDKEEDYPVCFMHYFNHCSEHLESNMLPELLL